MTIIILTILYVLVSYLFILRLSYISTQYSEMRGWPEIWLHFVLSLFWPITAIIAITLRIFSPKIDCQDAFDFKPDGDFDVDNDQKG
jgi:hypothetical protein